MEVSEKSSADDLDRVGATLATAKNQIREAIQDLTGPQMEAIIKKLENGEPLTQEEKDYVRSWIIGDAESYTRVENHLQAWLQEFRALQSAVKGYEGKEVAVQNLSNLHAILEDAVRVAANIEDFLEKKERIERFERSIQNIDKEDASFIVSILRGQLQSEEV
jgi:glutaredoxin 2